MGSFLKVFGGILLLDGATTDGIITAADTLVLRHITHQENILLHISTVFYLDRLSWKKCGFLLVLSTYSDHGGGG